MSSNEPCKLLFVVNDAAYFLSHRLPVAAAARDAGYDVHVATPDGHARMEVLNAGFAHHCIPLTRKGYNPLEESGSIISLMRLYSRLRPDIVHLVTIKPMIYGGIAARMMGVPAVVNAVTGLGYVFISRGAGSSLLRSVVRIGYKAAFSNRNQRIIFQNRDDSDTFLDEGIVDLRDITIIRGSGVDASVFTPTPEPAGVPVVLMASRMLRDKGVGEFVKAAALLRARGVNARFVLAGDNDPGNPASVPASKLKEWSGSGVVEWCGQRRDMPALFSKANIVCLPSYREGLPKVLIEAAACGRAIVATDAPGCREIVRHGENGLLVPVRDSEALAGALQKLINDPELRAHMGKRGRKLAIDEFTKEQVAAETLAVYQELRRNIENGP